jgi:hypothetical protein
MSVVDRNDREELTSVYEVGLMSYSVERLCNVKKDNRAHAFVFKRVFHDESVFYAVIKLCLPAILYVHIYVSVCAMKLPVYQHDFVRNGIIFLRDC